MADNGSESYNSKSVDPELTSRGPEEKMVVRHALRRSREEAHARQHSDSFHWKYIASAQMAHGSCVLAVPSLPHRRRCGPSSVQTRWRMRNPSIGAPSIGHTMGLV